SGCSPPSHTMARPTEWRLPSSPFARRDNRSVHSKVSADGVTDAGDVFGDESLVRRAGDRLSRCPRFVRGTCVGRKPETYQRGSNSDRLCDVPNSLAIRVYRPDDGSPGVHVQQHATASSKIRAGHNLCSIRSICAARSPMITQGAMVLPVVTRGMIDPSAMRRLSTPYTFRSASTTHISCRPILAVDV